jgi:phosphoenolpyruvate synthase/pyruvate phosphate dikinase
VTVERDAHPKKHRRERFLTDEGLEIDESGEHPSKADSRIVATVQPDSNVTVERDLHPEKHRGESFVTDDGMQIDESDEHS